jgi:hypothetical protein
MEQALAVRWRQCRKSKGGSSNQTGTVFNILHAFDLQLHKIQMQNQVTSTSNLCATATIYLPFQVEPEMVLCETNVEAAICSVNLYVVLKKVFKTKDKMVTNRMTVKVSNSIKKSATNMAYSSNYQRTTSLIKMEKETNGYSSSGSSTTSRPTKKQLRSLHKSG